MQPLEFIEQLVSNSEFMADPLNTVEAMEGELKRIDNVIHDYQDKKTELLRKIEKRRDRSKAIDGAKKLIEKLKKEGHE